MHTPAYQCAMAQLNQLDPSNIEDLYQMVAACVAIGLTHPQKSMILTGITGVYIEILRQRRIYRWHGGSFGVHINYIKLLERIHDRIDQDAVIRRVPMMRRTMERIQFFKSLDDDFA